MIWQDGELFNPKSGRPLRRDAAHSFCDDAADERFPVVDEIPFLRVGREELKNEALRALDAGDKKAALICLLQDRDDWATGEPPTEKDLQPLFENPELNLRGAMQCLKYGAVADYFAYRWSDPTFLSGLCLLDRHLPTRAKNVFELCCGIGHYLREMLLRGFSATGADVVFSKLWLARKFVAPEAKLICFDANFAFPFARNRFDSAFCHDAFYFLPNKRHVAAELKRTAAGAILIGHAHNGEVDNLSSGAAVSVAEYRESFGDPVLYDDGDLTRAVVENRSPKEKSIDDLKRAAAIAIVERAEIGGRNKFDLPAAGQSLVINPLLDAGDFQISKKPNFPSERYEKEYAALSDYLLSTNDEITFADQEMMFYGHWQRDERLTNLARRRIFLDLPEKW